MIRQLASIQKRAATLGMLKTPAQRCKLPFS